MCKKLFSGLMAITMVLLCMSSAVMTASAHDVIFDDVFTTGFDFTTSGYNHFQVPTTGAYTLSDTGLNITTTDPESFVSIEKTLPEAVTSGGVCVQFDFMFDTLKTWENGGLNYNFPAIYTTDGKTYSMDNLTADASKLAGTAIQNGKRYRYIVNANPASAKYDVYLLDMTNPSAPVYISGVTGKSITSAFESSATKDIKKIGLVVGGNGQSLNLYELKAYKIDIPAPTPGVLYEEQFTGPDGVIYPDGWGKLESFAADNKPAYDNSMLRVNSYNATGGGGYVRPNIPHINAVDNLTMEYEFAMGNVVLDCSDYFGVLTNDSPYNTESPFRAQIKNKKVAYYNGWWQDISPELQPNTSYKLKTIINFTTKTQLFTLTDITNHQILTRQTLGFSSSSFTGGTTKGEYKDVGFTYFIFYLNSKLATADAPAQMYLDNIRFYVSPSDPNMLVNDTFDDWVQGYKPQSLDGYTGINAQNITIDNGRLKITRAANEGGGFNRVLSAPVTSGKVIVEFDSEFVNSPVKVESYAFPAVNNSDDLSICQPQIVNNNKINKGTGFLMDAGVKYKSIFALDYDTYQCNYFIQNLSDPAAPVYSVPNAENTTFASNTNKNLAKLFFLLTDKDTANAQTLYLDNIKIYRMPQGLSVQSVTDGSGSAIAQYGVSPATNIFKINFDTALDPATLGDIKLMPALAGKASTLSADGKTVTLTYTGQLNQNTVYTLLVPPTVKNLNGDSCVNGSKSFSTEYDSNHSVVVSNSYLTDFNGGGVDVIGNGNIRVHLSVTNNTQAAKSGMVTIVVKDGAKLVGVRCVPFTELAANTESDEITGDFTLSGVSAASCEAFIWDGAYAPYAFKTTIPQL